jgi:ElaB/YqjD/DUF883 family membrane-anchored ribosome-binding protein
MEETKETPLATPPPAEPADTRSARFNRAKEAVGEKYAQASQVVGEKYTQASQAVRNKYTAVREKVDDIDFAGATDKVRAYVRENPGKALLISVGIGFAIGMLLRRSRRDDD